MGQVFTREMGTRILERHKRELMRRLAAVPDEIKDAVLAAVSPEDALRIYGEALEAVFDEAERWTMLEGEPLRTIRAEAMAGWRP